VQPRVQTHLLGGRTRAAAAAASLPTRPGHAIRDGVRGRLIVQYRCPGIAPATDREGRGPHSPRTEVDQELTNTALLSARATDLVILQALLSQTRTGDLVGAIHGRRFPAWSRLSPETSLLQEFPSKGLPADPRSAPRLPARRGCIWVASRCRVVVSSTSSLEEPSSGPSLCRLQSSAHVMAGLRHTRSSGPSHRCTCSAR
jgi:hypothetical protein